MKRFYLQYKKECQSVMTLLLFFAILFVIGSGMEELSEETKSVRVIVLDRCQYLKGQNYTHKENCTNLIHKIIK